MTNERDYTERLIDEDDLTRFLQEELGEADSHRFERHPEGHSNETIFIAWGDLDLVLRRPPPGETADTAHDVLREFHVMDALQDADVRVPRTVAACDDHDVIGSDFYLMDRLAGDVIRDDEPERFATPDHRRAVSEELVDAIAEVHQVDVDAVGLDDFGYPEGYTERQVERWTKQYEWAFEVTAEERTVPAVREVGDWLAANCPKDHPHTLVHGDSKLDNVLYAPGTPPCVSAVLDWELSTLGDPFCDLGWMLSTWWDQKDPQPPGYDNLDPSKFTTREGYLTRRELVEQYERATGLSFERPRFYRALAMYKHGALGEMFFRRHLEGNSDDDLYPHMEQGVPAIADRTLRIIEGEEPL